MGVGVSLTSSVSHQGFLFCNGSGGKKTKPRKAMGRVMMASIMNSQLYIISDRPEHQQIP